MKKSEEEWKKQLDAETYEVLRKKATERPFTGKYLHSKEKGMYVCAGCGAPLFSSDTKFESGTGWPSFWSPAEKENVEEKSDHSLFMNRVEILCKNCGGHLGGWARRCHTRIVPPSFQSYPDRRQRGRNSLSCHDKADR